jgi:hypothetical protein
MALRLLGVALRILPTAVSALDSLEQEHPAFAVAGIRASHDVDHVFRQPRVPFAVRAFDRPLHKRACERGEREARTPQARSALRIAGLPLLPARPDIGALFRMRCLFHVPTPSRRNAKHGDAIARVQLQTL